LTVASDTVVGTTGDDSITGARIDTVQTLNSGDSIALGAGTDSLSATLNAGTTTPAAITGVESITFTALGNATVDFDNVSGVTSLTSQGSSATLTVDDIQALVTSVTVNNATATNTFTFKDAAVAGTADSITVNLSGVALGAGEQLLIGGEADDDGGIETINVVASNGASDLGDGGGFGTTATTITVNASAALDLGSDAEFNAVTNFDASASTAGVTAVFGNRAAASETALSFKGGAGADSFDLGALAIANHGDLTVDMGAGNDTLDVGANQDTDTGSSYVGGAGVDTLIISTTALTVAEGARYSGFEALTIETSVTQDADAFAGTTINTGAAALTLVINDLQDDSTINLNHSSTSVTMNRKTDTATDGLTVNIGGTAGAVTATALVFDTQYENITINSQGTAANTITAFATNVVNNMTLTGGTALTLTSTDNITGVIDFSASTANNIVTVTDTTAQKINFGSGNDTVTATGVVANGETQIINGGAGNDTINSGNLAAGGILTINGDAGSDTISYNGANTGASVHNVNGGAGIDFITLGQHAGTLDDVISTVTATADADEVTGFVTTTDDFDYNGTVLNDTATTITAVANATLAGGLAADADATVYIVTTALTGAAATDMTALVAESTVAGVLTDYATFEASLVAQLGTITALDSTLSASESVLLNVDDGTNSVILRVTNTDTTVANTLTVDELELVAVMVAADDLVVGDFI
jgi:hypothetical protein